MDALNKYRKTALQKGTVVYQFRDWNHKGTVQVRKMVVGSWGKKQGYIHTLDNENARERIYNKQCGNCSYGNFIAVADLTDAELQAVAQEIAQAVHDKWVASSESVLARNPDAPQAYIRATLADLAKIKANGAQVICDF